jgi:hypothetical protein
MDLVKEKTQQQEDHPILMDAGRPEKGGRNEKNGGRGQEMVVEESPEGAEHSDAAPKNEKRKKQGIDIEIVKGQKIEKQVHEADGIVGEIEPCRIIPDKKMKIGEELMTGNDALVEKTPDIAMMREIAPGDQIVQTAGGDTQGKKQNEHEGFYPAVPEEWHSRYSITQHGGINNEQEQVHRLPGWARWG